MRWRRRGKTLSMSEGGSREDLKRNGTPDYKRKHASQQSVARQQQQLNKLVQ